MRSQDGNPSANTNISLFKFQKSDLWCETVNLRLCRPTLPVGVTELRSNVWMLIRQICW